MILVLDNRDSFVLNLARYVRLAGAATTVVRSTELSVDQVLTFEGLQGIVLSPGPGRPEDAGICIELLQSRPNIPIYGVCLGHQCMGTAFGGATVRSPMPTHGQASLCIHEDDAMFAGVPSNYRVGRYHSLTVEVPEMEFYVTARSEFGEVMAMRHHELPYFGVQYHPESLLSEYGHVEVANFINYCKKFHND